MDNPRIEVLLIEDDEVDREAVNRHLNTSYTIRTATDAQSALASVSRRRPDVVLLDYRLPDVRGLDLLDQLVRLELPVVILTVEERPEVVVATMQRGATDFIVKRTLSESSLKRAIVNAIERTELRRKLEASRRQLEEQAHSLSEKNRQIEELAAALTLTEQRERHHVAQILHDHLQQVLYALRFRMRLVQTNENQEVLHEVSHLIDEAIHTTRTLTVDLSPPILKGEGLEDALVWLIHQMGDEHGLEVDIQLELPLSPVSQEMRVMIFRLVRELLFNVVKHAGVNEAVLRVRESEGRLMLEVEDQGSGFHVERLVRQKQAENVGIGLYGIRRRLHLFGGKLEIDSRPQQGSRIVIELPLSRILLSSERIQVPSIDQGTSAS